MVEAMKFDSRRCYRSGPVNVLGIPATLAEILRQKYDIQDLKDLLFDLQYIDKDLKVIFTIKGK